MSFCEFLATIVILGLIVGFWRILKFPWWKPRTVRSCEGFVRLPSKEVLELQKRLGEVKTELARLRIGWAEERDKSSRLTTSVVVAEVERDRLRKELVDMAKQRSDYQKWIDQKWIDEATRNEAGVEQVDRASGGEFVARLFDSLVGTDVKLSVALQRLAHGIALAEKRRDKKCGGMSA